jgi:hypothetical protein
MDNRRRWSSLKRNRLCPKLFAQHWVLFPEVVGQVQLLLLHPAGHTAISRNRNGSRDFVMRKVTLSPDHQGGASRPVGDPLQIYADRFSGHYEVGLWQSTVAKTRS